jgi:hypothetical protein
MNTMDKHKKPFRSWLTAIPLRTAILTLIFVFMAGTFWRLLFRADAFLRDPLREIVVGVAISSLVALYVYRQLKNLDDKNKN